MDSQQRLLVIACSARKRPNVTHLPAIERYNGPVFQLVRHYLNTIPNSSVDIRVLSAKFGLIFDNTPIPAYDQRMTRTRANEVRMEATGQLADALHTGNYEDVCLCMGQLYLNGINIDNLPIESDCNIHIITGSLGRQLVELRQWLHKNEPASSATVQPLHSSSDGQQECIRSARLRNVELHLSTSEAVHLARSALDRYSGGPAYQSWYVLIDGQRAAPKWLVGQLTGLPRHAFHSQEARRVLQQLGFEVHCR